jgi:hypothetical protein
MKKNMHSGDRITRLVIAGLLIILYLNFNISFIGKPGIILLGLCWTLIITGLVGFCPLYSIFRISTCSVKEG